MFPFLRYPAKTLAWLVGFSWHPLVAEPVKGKHSGKLAIEGDKGNIVRG